MNERAAGPTRLRAHIEVEESYSPPQNLRDKAREWLRAAGDTPARRELPAGPCEVAVIFAGDGLLSALNAGFRGKHEPTNVLAFPGEIEDGLEWSEDEPCHLGDIAVSLETAAREAAAQDRPLEARLCHLTVHALLHLLGYDHQNDDDAELMESQEKRILAGFGFDDPYADENPGLSRRPAAPAGARDG